MSCQLLFPFVVFALATRGSYADVTSLGHAAFAPTVSTAQLRGGSSVASSLRLKNSVTLPLTIAVSCTENHTLLVGQELQLAISKPTTFWILPQGKAWDCKAHCPDCFYVRANITANNTLIAAVGYGDMEESAATRVGVDSVATIKRLPGIPAANGAEIVAGVELVPAGRFDGAKDAASCTQIFCDFDRSVLAGKRGLDLEIHGASILEDLAPFWREGDPKGQSWGYYHRANLARSETRRYRRCWWLSETEFSCAWIEG